MDIENVSNKVPWLDKDFKRYKEMGCFIPKGQIRIYNSIARNWTAGRTVLDLGCSAGYGSNLLSKEARHVWGIDINEEAIAFAKHMFERPNLSFSVFDIENPIKRPVAPFEVITMIEVLEHLPNYEKGIQTLKSFFDLRLETIAFVTVPNINNARIKRADAKNDLHVNHWTPGEFYELMIGHFRHVTMYNADRLGSWGSDSTVDGTEAGASVIVAKLEGCL